MTTRLNKRWPAARRAAWLRIVGGAKSARLRERRGADRLARLLEVAHRVADLREADARVLDADRQRRVHRGHAVAQRALLDVGAHGDGHHRPQHQAVGVVPARAQPAAERERHGGEDDVVERAAQLVLDRLDALEVGVDPVVAAVRADRDVEAARAARGRARRGPSPPRPQAARPWRAAPGAGRGSRSARRAPPRREPWRARAARRRAAAAAGGGRARRPRRARPGRRARGRRRRRTGPT